MVGRVLNKTKVFRFSLYVFLEFLVNLSFLIPCHLQSQKSNDEFPSPQQVRLDILVMDPQRIKQFSFKSFVNVLYYLLIFLHSAVYVPPVTVIYRFNQNLLNRQFEDVEKVSEGSFIHDD